METEVIKFKKLDLNAIIPTRATAFSVGFDLYALKDVMIDPFAGNILVHTGIAVQLPPGTYGRIAIRSGLAVEEYLTVHAGIIDRDNVDQIIVVVSCTKLYDEGDGYRIPHRGCKLKKGARFAQLIVERVCDAPGVEVTEFEHLGFGSTGK